MMWRYLEERAEHLLTSVVNSILAHEMSKESRRHALEPVLKNKGDVKRCNNYRGWNKAHEPYH